MAGPAWFWAKKCSSFKQLHYTVLKMIRAGEADMAVVVSVFSAAPNIYSLFSVHHWVGIQFWC